MSPAASAPSPRERAPRDAGFSLLEVMVAVAIFALTVMTLFVIRGRAVEQAYLAKNIDMAQRYGKLLLEDVLLGDKVYTDGDSGTFEPPEAKNLTYEVFVEEVTVAGTPPDEEEQGRRGAPTVGGRLAKSSQMDELFGSGRKSGRSSGSSDDGLAADADASGQADAGAGAGASASSGKKKKKKGGGGGGLFGGDDEDEEPEILYRVIVKVHYPVLDKNETLTLETLVPPPPEEGDDEEAGGATDDGAGGKGKGQGKGGQGGGKGGGKKKGGGGGKGKKGQGAADDLFGGG